MESIRRIDRFIRFYLLPIGLTLWFGFLCWRLYVLHSGGVGPSKHNNIRYKQDIKAMRGVIYDRGGNPIAVNEAGWKIYLDPCAIQSPLAKG